jgi:hypothetical protein
MGTSGSYGGPSPGSPLIPDFVDPIGSPPVGPETPAPDADGLPPPAVPPAPPERAPLPPAPDDRRFTGARGNLTIFARSGGNDRKALGRAVGGYVATSTAGARTAARRMASSRGTSARLATFLGSVSSSGAREALRFFNLESLAGRPIEEIFSELSDYLCPEGGTVDDGIARDAFIETIADLAAAGIADLDALTPAQMQTVFELYAAHAIEARICNDIGSKSITLPADIAEVGRIQAILTDFIQRAVSDAVTRAQIDFQNLPPNRLQGIVDAIYESAFDILQTMGEGEAEP